MSCTRIHVLPYRLLDGPGRYRLVGIVSHMGSSTACGHYVAHVFKGGRWVIFNDEKVRGDCSVLQVPYI